MYECVRANVYARVRACVRVSVCVRMHGRTDNTAKINRSTPSEQCKSGLRFFRQFFTKSILLIERAIGKSSTGAGRGLGRRDRGVSSVTTGFHLVVNNTIFHLMTSSAT